MIRTATGNSPTREATVIILDRRIIGLVRITADGITCVIIQTAIARLTVGVFKILNIRLAKTVGFVPRRCSRAN